MISESAVLDIARDAISAASFSIADHWIDCQYLSDGDIHSGTDTYLCSEDSRCICDDADLWIMDVKQYVEFY